MRLGNIALTAVVARMVAPHELGIFTIAVTLHAFLTSVAELGIASAVARSDLDQSEIEPTVAGIAIVTSASLGALVELFADPLAGWLGDSDSAASIRILAIGIVLVGPFAVPGAALQRAYRQDVVFKAAAIAFLPGSLLLVGLAALGDGATAFAWSRILGQLIMGFVMVRSVGWPPIRVNVHLIRPLLAFGIPLAAANLVSQIVLNADYVVIAHVLSADAVGLFGMAFNVASWPAAVMGTVLNGMVLPVISGVVRDGGDLSGALRHGLHVVATAAFPVAAFTGFYAHPLLTALFGTRWAGASWSLVLLAVYGGLFVLGLMLANAVVALGRTGGLLAIQLLALVLLVPCLIAGARLAGLEGVAAAHTLVILFGTMPAYLVISRRLAGFGALDLARSIAGPAVSAVACALVSWGITLGITAPWLNLLSGGLVFLVLYAILARRTLVQMLPANTAQAVSQALHLERWSQ